MIFKGSFFSGVSSARHDAQIKLDTYQLTITYTNQRLEESTIVWDTDKIHPTDFAEEDKVILKYGEFPFQYIEVPDKSFETALKWHYPKAKFHQSVYNRVFNGGILALAGVLVLFVAFLAFAYFYLLPTAAERLAMHIPQAAEEQLGEAVFSSMTEHATFNNEASEHMNNFFKKLNYPSKYKVEISVVHDDMVNAFALPGGKIVVYEGIINEMETYEELAALLSHEFSHVQLKHSTRNICRSLSSYLLLSVLFGDASGLSAVLIQNADQLKQLGYSRKLEQEADINGLTLMKGRQISPTGMQQLFEVLKGQEGSSAPPQFLSTHPLTENRIKYVQQEINKGGYTEKEDEELKALWENIKRNI